MFTTTARADQERVLRRVADDRQAEDAAALAEALAPALSATASGNSCITRFLAHYPGEERAGALRLALLHGVLSLWPCSGAGTGPDGSSCWRPQPPPPLAELRARVRRAASTSAVCATVPKMQRALLDLQERLDQAYEHLEDGRGRLPLVEIGVETGAALPVASMAAAPTVTTTVLPPPPVHTKTRATDNQGATIPTYPDWWGDCSGEAEAGAARGGGSAAVVVAAATTGPTSPQQQHQSPPIQPPVMSTTTTTDAAAKYKDKGSKRTGMHARRWRQRHKKPLPPQEQRSRTPAVTLVAAAASSHHHLAQAGEEDEQSRRPSPPPAIAATAARLAADPWASWFYGAVEPAGDAGESSPAEDEQRHHHQQPSLSPPPPPPPPATDNSWQADFGHLDAPSLDVAVRELREVEERRRQRWEERRGAASGRLLLQPSPHPLPLGVRPEVVEASRTWVGDYKKEMVEAKAAATARERLMLLAASDAADAAGASEERSRFLMSPEELRRLVCSDGGESSSSCSSSASSNDGSSEHEGSSSSGQPTEEDEEEDDDDDNDEEAAGGAATPTTTSAHADDDNARIAALLREIELEMAGGQ
jgi:hypothetical protein